MGFLRLRGSHCDFYYNFLYIGSRFFCISLTGLWLPLGFYGYLYYDSIVTFLLTCDICVTFCGFLWLPLSLTVLLLIIMTLRLSVILFFLISGFSLWLIIGRVRYRISKRGDALSQNLWARSSVCMGFYKKKKRREIPLHLPKSSTAPCWTFFVSNSCTLGLVPWGCHRGAGHQFSR